MGMDRVIHKYFCFSSFLDIVRGRRTAVGGLGLVDVWGGARLEVHRRGQGDRLVADHLARAEVLEVGVDGARGVARGALELNLRGLAGVTDFVSTAGLVVLARAVGRWARLATQVVFEVDHIAFDLGHGVATNNTELHTTLVAVFILHWVQRVRERTRALVDFFLVGTRIVAKSVRTHCREMKITKSLLLLSYTSFFLRPHNGSFWVCLVVFDWFGFCFICIIFVGSRPIPEQPNYAFNTHLNGVHTTALRTLFVEFLLVDPLARRVSTADPVFLVGFV